MWGCSPEGLRAGKGAGGTPSLPSLTGNPQETAKPAGKHPSCKPGGRVLPPLPGEVRGKGEALGLRGDTPSPCRRHPEPTGCPLWQRGRKERRGTAPHVRHSEPRDTGTAWSTLSSALRDRFGALPLPTGLRARTQPDTDRQERWQDSRARRGDREGDMDPSTSQIIPCRVRTDRHKEPRDTTQRRQDTPQGDPSLDFRVGLARVPPLHPSPGRSTGPLQRLVGAVLRLDELDDEEGDGLDAQHQHDAPDETRRVEAGWAELGAACQRGTGGGGPWWPGKQEVWGVTGVLASLGTDVSTKERGFGVRADPSGCTGRTGSSQLGLGCSHQYVDAGLGSAPSHARAAGAAGKKPVANRSQWDQ